VRGVIVILAFAFAGCAGSEAVPEQWTKPGAVRGQLEADIFTCQQWSTWGGQFSQDDFGRCMVATGWRPAGPSGTPPAGAVAAR
jgi:hypothetical protein